jgi:hypothetical protein
VGWAVFEGGGVVQCIRYRKKKKKTFLFCFQVSWVQFLMVVASINLLGAMVVICSAREHPCKSY